MSQQEAEEDDWDWHEFNQWCKERHRAHVAKNMEDYQKYIFQMEKLGFSETPLGAGHRFTHTSGIRIDFWRQSGKWTIVGTNKYVQGPRKMIREAKGLVADWNELHRDPELSPQEWAKKQYDQTPTESDPEEDARGNYGDLREDLKGIKRGHTLKYSEPRDDDLLPWEE